MRPFQFLFVFIFSAWAFAQEHPTVMSFAPDNYAAENQNWDITQTDNQFMYFANNSRLLEFNGSKWAELPLRIRLNFNTELWKLRQNFPEVKGFGQPYGC